MLRKNHHLKIYIIFVTTTLLVINTFAENNWNVPEDKKAKNSYIRFDKATTSQGEAIYNKNCVSCHGNPEKGNSLKSLSPIPPDLSSSNSQQFTDGELFYILTTGRLIMPSFKNILSEDDRWKTISYIRSFNKTYIQTVSKFDPNKSKLIKVDIQYDASKNQINIFVVANEKSGKLPLKDAEIALFVKRYFGRLQIDKTTRTDKNGSAHIAFPKDLPGNKTGLVELIVKINDENYGEIESMRKLKIGIPTDKPALNAERAIWNVLIKAPVWIIAFFSFGILCVGLLMLFIFINLRKLYISGNK